MEREVPWKLVQTGMVGVNVGIPAPVPFAPFGGMKNSIGHIEKPKFSASD